MDTIKHIDMHIFVNTAIITFKKAFTRKCDEIRKYREKLNLIPST